jgi:hypothetical protein
MWKIGCVVLFSTVAFGQSAAKSPQANVPAEPPQIQEHKFSVDLRNAPNPQVQNAIPPKTCSIPLTSLKPGNGNGAIQSIAPRQTDPKIIRKPAAPTCDDKATPTVPSKLQTTPDPSQP